MAAAISPDPGVPCSAEVVSDEQVPNVEWEKVALLLWQGPLPDGEAARHVQEFVKRGGYAIFLPPKVPGDREFFGARWKSWVESPSKDALVANWRGDQDLLANTQSGALLPVGQLQVHRYCRLTGDVTAPVESARRRSAFGPIDAKPQRCLFLRDDDRSLRFVAGDRRRRALRPGATGDGGRGLGLGHDSSTDGRRSRSE